MASTSRKTTASFRRKNHKVESDRPRQDGRPGLSPALSTALQPNCQEAYLADFRSLEQAISLIERPVEVALESHSLTKGATVSISRGNLVGQRLFAVSIFPSRTIELSAPPTRNGLLAFAILNADLLLTPDCAFGLWYDKHGSLHHFLDVVVAVADLQQALELGQIHGQRFAYDLEQQEEITIPHLIPVNPSSVIEAAND